MSGAETKREHVGRVVEKEIAIDATPEEVWDAWADPRAIARWFVDAAEGRMAAGETVTWIWETFGYRMPIEVYEAVRGERLVFGGEAPGRPPALQEVFIRQEGGSTVLRLANSGFLDGEEHDEEFGGVDSGWEMALATLKHQLERYPGRRRVHHLAMRPAAFEYDQVRPLYTTAAGLASWLAPEVVLGSEPAAVGDAVRVGPAEALAGAWLDGHYLARTGAEALLSWPRRDAVLGLKAFKMGAMRAVALDYSAWPAAGAEEGVGDGVRGLLESAIDRLVALVGPPGN